MDDRIVQYEMEKREEVLEEHLRAENAHDVDAIMETFSENAQFVFNGAMYNDLKIIRLAHEKFGFSEGGGFSDIRVVENHRYASDSAIVLEETVSAKHTGEWAGIPATGRAIELPVCAVYKFDAQGKLVGENVYFDGALLLRQLGALA